MPDDDNKDTGDNQDSIAGYRKEEWKPNLAHTAIWSVLTLGLSIIALAALIILYQWLGRGNGLVESTFVSLEREADGSTVFTVNVLGFGLVLLSIVAVLIIHEAIHGAMFRYFGGRPEYGAAILHKILPVLYCTAHGYRFSRGQFAIIVLAPAALISAAGIPLIAFTNAGHWFIAPVGINLGGAIGDFWMAGMLTRKPEGTLVEDRKDGLRFFIPDRFVE